MLVTFKTDAYSNITMFGDTAVRLLKLMGHSGTVPSALSAEDVPEALERLRRGIAEHGDEADERPRREADDEEQQAPVSLAQRAYPLLELLTAAAAADKPVMWK